MCYQPLLLFPLALCADDDTRKSRLVASLKHCEQPIECVRGELLFRSLRRKGPNVDASSSLERQYAFAYQPGFRHVSYQDREQSGLSPTVLWSLNPRYAFSLARREKQWVITSIQDAAALGRTTRNPFTSFDRHFEPIHTIGGKPLSQMLISKQLEARTSWLACVALIHANSRSSSGLEEFNASVAVPAGLPYAYVLSSRSVARGPRGTWEVRIDNEVVQESSRPRLTRSKMVMRELGTSEPQELEFVREWKTWPIEPDAHVRLFQLSDYGFPEPEFTEASPVGSADRFLWFFILLIAGVMLMVVGKNLSRTRK